LENGIVEMVLDKDFGKRFGKGFIEKGYLGKVFWRNQVAQPS
jgi:hypothetical protein